MSIIPKRILLPHIIAGLAVVGIGYVGIQLLRGNQATPYTTTKSGAVSGASKMSQTATDADEQRLRTVLNGIPGMQEVALASTPEGVTVTATIDSPYGVEPSVTSAPTASLMNEYLADVFESDSNVVIAQLYYVEDGQLVAGGALSRDAYHQWTVGTMQSKGNTALLRWMASLTQHGSAEKSASNDTGWFETEQPVSGNMG